MDTGVFSDRKIRKLLKMFGPSGYLVYNFVLCEIYRDRGYYVDYNEDFVFDVADQLNLTESLVCEIITFCASGVLFDQGAFGVAGVLTSSGIQRRYLQIKARSAVSIRTDINLLNAITPVNDAITPVNAEIMRQSKVNIFKRNKRKKEKSFCCNNEKVSEKKTKTEKRHPIFGTVDMNSEAFTVNRDKLMKFFSEKGISHELIERIAAGIVLKLPGFDSSAINEIKKEAFERQKSGAINSRYIHIAKYAKDVFEANGYEWTPVRSGRKEKIEKLIDNPDTQK
ncbi:MAG: DUF4373 domain-containing protein [Planctomycetaceae bacterium]|jgi:hypothetical protein|nr:DUF4373 domain-containing protein [Planctomycetaceae bacterium]